MLLPTKIMELTTTKHVERISNWAYDLFISLRGEPYPELDNILDRISLMGAGPEFEYSREELRLLAEFRITTSLDDPPLEVFKTDGKPKLFTSFVFLTTLHSGVFILFLSKNFLKGILYQAFCMSL